MRRLLMKTGWCALFFFALLNCILAMRYLLPRVPFPSQLPNFTLHRIALTGHAACAGIALLAGPFQFLDTLRRRWPRFHRRMGWLYIGSVALAAAFALPLILHAGFGPISVSYTHLKSSAVYFKAVQDRVKTLADSRQLSLFGSGDWGHPAYKLPPEANLMAVAHYIEALKLQREFIRIQAVLGLSLIHI